MSKIKIRRRFPNPKDILQLLKFKPLVLNGRRRRLSGAHTIYDLRSIAKRRTPQAPFDYTDGSADMEISISRARKAFEGIEFQPSILKDVRDVDLSLEVLGKRVSMPLGIAPTGFTRMMHTEGEFAGATAAEEFGIPFALSTMGTRSIEEVAGVAPEGINWFQLYMWKDRDRSMALVERAKAAGFDALMLTVDVPVAGDRLRDKYNGMTIPPALTLKTITNALPRPEWWINFLTTDALKFASLDSWNGTVGELLDTMFDPTVDFEDLQWIKEQWGGKVIVKGVQNVSDAKKLASLGVDAVVLSNHGGRQLDRAPVPFYLLPEVRRELKNDLEVMIDTGIMHGADVIAAMAQGASFTLVGRAYLYGLMAGGREGVDRALTILQGQMLRTMKLLGVRSLAELEPSHVKLVYEQRR
ncbi:alpha-hydroxy-acid oxidizing protein [Aquiluna sp.]|jgi:L-lactate dehydrogenase (cytochrome)|nr:alpha-hydroxy-acid oxidizing protein [Aquiluna sp.]